MGIRMPVVCMLRWTAGDTGCPGVGQPSQEIGMPTTASAIKCTSAIARIECLFTSRNSAVDGLRARSSCRDSGAMP